MVKAGDARRDIQPCIVGYDVLQITAAGTDFECAFVSQTISIDEGGYTLFDPVSATRRYCVS